MSPSYRYRVDMKEYAVYRLKGKSSMSQCCYLGYPLSVPFVYTVYKLLVLLLSAFIDPQR
jgi:hypothetical protein